MAVYGNKPFEQERFRHERSFELWILKDYDNRVWVKDTIPLVIHCADDYEWHVHDKTTFVLYQV